MAWCVGDKKQQESPPSGAGIACRLPSFNFKPWEDPETLLQCYYEFLAREILADVPAG